ncbi:GRIM-19 [Amylostereum chailletii]|nr:GRIM-19 [Amylostereum chailletii]
MPPAGGFEAVKYKRNLPFRGPSGLAILGGVSALCAYGFYRLGKGNIEKRELQRELTWSRIHLVPLLLAEGDRDAFRRQHAAVEREKAIMQGVEGWEAGKSVYNNPRYRSTEYVVVL